jgi:hypothetical protein
MRPGHYVMTSSNVSAMLLRCWSGICMARLRSQVHGEHATAGVALRRRTALFGVCCLLPLVRRPDGPWKVEREVRSPR